MPANESYSIRVHRGGRGRGQNLKQPEHIIVTFYTLGRLVFVLNMILLALEVDQ